MNNKELSDLFKVIADESRLKIIRLLNKNGKMIGVNLLPYLKCKQATLSHHMAILVESELVKEKKKGNTSVYSLNRKMLFDILSIFFKDEKEISKFKEDPDIIRDLENVELIEKDDDSSTKDVPVYLL